MRVAPCSCHQSLTISQYLLRLVIERSTKQLPWYAGRTYFIYVLINTLCQDNDRCEYAVLASFALFSWCVGFLYHGQYHQGF